MARVQDRSGAAIWAAVVVGLVLLVGVFGYAVLTFQHRGEPAAIRIEGPSMPDGPKLPDPPKLPRGVG